MFHDMKQHFWFGNISVGAYHDIIDTVIATEYSVNKTYVYWCSHGSISTL